MHRLVKTLLFADLAKGLQLTGKRFMQVFRTANRRKVPFHIVSEYPEVPVQLPPRFRGRLQLLKDDQGEIKCVACMLCVKICPTQVITIEGGKKEGRQTRLPLRYDFEMERCVFCGFCVEVCPFDAIVLNDQFELASYGREDFSLGMLGTHQNMFDKSPVAKYSVAEDED